MNASTLRALIKLRALAVEDAQRELKKAQEEQAHWETLSLKAEQRQLSFHEDCALNRGNDFISREVGLEDARRQVMNTTNFLTEASSVRHQRLEYVMECRRGQEIFERLLVRVKDRERLEMINREMKDQDDISMSRSARKRAL